MSLPPLTHKTQTGFTLIELLVVLVVMGIALSMVVVQLLPDERAVLREEAQRLALLLENAGLEARANGRSLAWAVEKNNSVTHNSSEYSSYRFWQKNELSEWVRIADDRVFRARTLAEGVRVASVSVESQPLPPGEYLVLSAHAFSLPFQIQLVSGSAVANIMGHSTGTVSIQMNDPQ